MLPPIGGGAPFIFVAGPCVIEDRETIFTVAEVLSALDAPIVFKASFDKANRTRGDAFRGPGLESGLELLAEVKSRFALPILTDVHLPDQCARAAEVADVLQVPAFLCRQTDLICAAAATGRVVNIKRGQFLDPRQVRFAVEKASRAASVWVTERGTSFGHGDLVFDPRALVWMRDAGAPLLFDCTHSVQVPGGGLGETGGRRQLALPLARAAAAVGIDGIYAEIHPDPDRARSDAATQLTLDAFGRLVDEVTRIDRAQRGP